MNKETNNKIVPKLRFLEFKSEWEEVVLGEFGETISGLSGKTGTDFGTGKPYVTYMQVFSNAWIDLNQCGRVRIADNEKQNTLQRGDILITTSSETPDEVGFASVLLDNPNEDIFLNSFCFAYRPNNLKLFYPGFSLFLFRSSIYRKAIRLLAQGSTRFNISKGAFLKLKIPITKEEREQQKIADCLSSLDELITAQSQKLEALKAHKKGLMQQLFPVEGETVPKLRFAEFRDKGGWEAGEVADLIDTVMGNAFKSSDFVEEGIQLLRMGNLYQGELDLDRTPVFLPTHFEEQHTRFLVKSLDLLMSMTGTAGKRDYGFIVQIPQDCSLLLLNQRVAKIVPKENSIRDFIFQLLKSDSFLQQLYSRPGGTKQANLSVEQLIEIKITFPKPKEQKKIADCLSSIDKIITAQAEKIEAFKEHKKGLMQQLFPNEP